MGIVDNALIGASGQSGYNLTRSLRFRASASAYLNRTPASSGSLTTMTWSYWVKFGFANTGTDWDMFTAGAADGASIRLLSASNKFRIYDYNGSAFSVNLITTQVFRDPSAWYHIVIAIDSTQATSSNRAKLYVNGSQVTAFDTAVYPSLNQSMYRFNSNVAHNIGRQNFTAAQYFDGYLTEVNFIDGQALTPSSFGSTNTLTGVWQPARYTGTYGTNGFYLPFTDNSALTTSSNVGLGKDFSGNGNYWATNNISITSGVTYDSMTDVPTLTSATAANFAVANPLSVGANTALTNGNLTGTFTGSGGFSATICGLTSGKWYYEATNTASAGNSRWVGFISDVYAKNDNAWSYSTQTALYANDGRNGNNVAYGATWTTNDVIGVALDLSTSSGSITFYKNGVSQGVMFSSLTSSAVWRPLVSSGGTGTTMVMNFGQQPFAYTPPTGYVALNTFNLPTSTIVKGNTVMDATLWTGDSTYPRSITNAAGFKPDLVWVKSRSTAYSHILYDSVRGTGTGANLSSDSTGAEGALSSYANLTAYNSNGFSVGSTSLTNILNNSGQTFVGWQWQAGQGTTSSNTSGTITSTVSVNASAGFSVVTYTGTGANATVGHGLGVAPSMIICKSRGASTNWGVWHTSLTSYSYFLLLNSTAAQATAANALQALPTSTLVSLGASSIFNDASTMVMYCWTPIAGYSSFGKYTGNGSTDGPFVYLGFRPKWVMVKASSAVENWPITDSARSPFNAANAFLRADESSAETTGAMTMDFNSNGFKMRTADGKSNGSGVTYIYIAYAENPFKNALAR